MASIGDQETTDVMLFWFIAAGLTALFTIIALWPLLRRTTSAALAQADLDVEVYSSQLSELESDLARGTITSDEAETAKAEIGRRLLKAARRADRESTVSHARQWKGAAVSAIGAAIVIPVVTVGLYQMIGSPGMPDVPLASRRGDAPTDTGVSSLVAHVEERLKAAPEDGRGWDVIAPVYLRLNRPADAVTAFRNAIRLLGSTAMRESGLGEALTRVAGGEVTDEARAAFDRALAQNEDFLPARFFVALDMAQEGRVAESIPAWRSLLKDSPPDAPWNSMAREALLAAEMEAGGDQPITALQDVPSDPEQTAATDEPSGQSGAVEPAAPVPDSQATPGPTSADMAAAAELSPDDQKAMIEGMVAQLAQRLEDSPNDVEGWKRLIRSYSVLNDAKRAEAAYDRAEQVFPEGSEEHTEIAALARQLGLGSPEETNTP
ncbi:c-type cytochrome biogenesis protein CcmI [Consotaella aegiceratis]|uniref:c-type cytochrome biogenesis protein CcmI n=1 Tax=Consotaella aegiceratis TaxID=3097961 RepID=UPI002F3FC70D